MTTNKPEVAAWGTFYKGTMQDFAYNKDGAERSASLDFHQRPLDIEPLVRLSDYERLQADHEGLQAECEKLRRDAERLDWIVSEGAIVAHAGVRGEPHRYRVEWPLLGEVTINWFTSERDAIDTAMQEVTNDN